jgi:hypothetical protein
MFIQKRLLVRSRLVIFTLSVLLGSWASADQNIYVETYAPLDPVDCDGLSLHDVNYAFTVSGTPSTDCRARRGGGPGNTNNLTTPVIEGTAAGILHLSFDVPTTVFGIGIALVGGPGTRAIIELNRPGVGSLREEVDLVLLPDPSFRGGRYDYEGAAVKTATIRFTGGNRMALDNLTYFRPPGKVKKD